MKKLIAVVIAASSLAVGAVTARAEDEALFASQSLTPETALKAATAALQKCRADGYQVTVVVSDRGGLMQALVRDRFAGAHTVEAARRKAWTSASFRTDTSEIVDALAENPQLTGIYQITEAMMVGGGKTIDAAGSLVGAIGVSGAPDGDIDDGCAQAGVAAIEFDIQF